ncbi:hypothetical protein JCM16358_11520 [Halanaerocella petrolearia]
MNRLGWKPDQDNLRIEVGDELGYLSFLNKRDVVRFSVNVAKDLGLTKSEFEELKEEIIVREKPFESRL